VNHWEREYNPRIGAREPERCFDSWRIRAAQARATLDCRTDIAYGAHERERLDLFRSPVPRGALVFLHGGYWRAFGKEDFSWIAAPFVQAGISVVIPSYPLCPLASLTEIGGSVARAMEYVVGSVLTSAERRRIILAGHSAGAHLAAHYAAHPSEHGVVPAIVDALVCVSGIFDLLPLLHAEFLHGMGWEAAELHAMSPLYACPPPIGGLVLAFGSDESREFRRQSERFAEAWTSPGTRVLAIPGKDHFAVLEDMCAADGVLARATTALFDP
jgi:arylformamidase